VSRKLRIETARKEGSQNHSSDSVCNDTPQVTLAMQYSENLHYVAIKAIKDHIRLDESAAEVWSDLRTATADLRESGECLPFS
jgi:hypothetical protein